MKQSQLSSLPTGVFIALLFWFAGVIVASVSGGLASLSPYSPPFIAGFSVLVSVLCYFLLPSLRSRFAAFGLRRLTALHILRIAAVPLFFWYGNRQLLPSSFVEAAGWGDLIAGTLALAVVLFWARPIGYWTAHVLGMVDFISAFATAAQLTAASPGAMHAVTGLPMSLIPFFGVGVLASSHVIAYDLLLSSRRLPSGRELYVNSAEIL